MIIICPIFVPFNQKWSSRRLMVMRSNDSIHRRCTFSLRDMVMKCSLFPALTACLFYRSKSRFHFGHSSYWNTAQLSSLCDWSAHHWSLFQVTFFPLLCHFDYIHPALYRQFRLVLMVWGIFSWHISDPFVFHRA